MVTFTGGSVHIQGVIGAATVSVPSSAPAAFDPQDTFGADVIAWWDVGDATTITLNGSDISQLDDKTTNGNDLVQATASQQPFYDSGNDRAQFDNTTSEIMATVAFTSALSQPNTIFFVAQGDNPVASYDVFFDGLSGTGQNQLDITSSGDKWLAWAGTAAPVSTNVSDQAKHIYVAIFDNPGNATILYVDGGTAEINSTTAGTDTLDGFTIFGEFDDTNHMNGDFYEAFVVDARATTGEINSVGSALAVKHSLTWTTIT